MTEREELEMLRKEQGDLPEEKPSLGKTIFPRAQGKTGMERDFAGLLDIVSLPGRFLGSTDAGKVDLGQMAEIEGQNLTQSILRDPTMIPSMAVGGGLGRAAAGLGTRGIPKALSLMGIGLGEGATSAGLHQADRMLQGSEFQPGLAGAEIGLGAALPLIPTGANKMLGRSAEFLSGVPEEALRAYGTGFGSKPQAIRAMSGKGNEIGQRLVDALDNADDFMPERQVVEKTLKGMGKVDISPTLRIIQDEIDKLKNPTAGKSALEYERKAIAALEADMKSMGGLSGKMPKTKFPAEGVRDLRKRLDTQTKFGDESDDLVNRIRIKARTQLKNDLIDAAKATGNREYVSAMESWADKIGKVDEVKKMLGSNTTTREQRVEAFIANLHGKNKTERQKLIQEVGEIFGEDFLKEAKAASMAAQLGEGGIPDLLSRHTTAKATIGPGLMGAGGLGMLTMDNPAFAASMLAGGALSSPMLGSFGLGMMDFGQKTLAPLAPAARATVRSGTRSLGGY